MIKKFMWYDIRYERNISMLRHYMVFIYIYIYIYIYTYTQGVPGGMCQTSGECSLGQTIPI